jgi:uncharacterized protein (TIGR02594 family)
MATKNTWADIDDAGYWHKPEAEDDSNNAAVTDEDIKPEPKPALVKLSEGQFIEPGMGYEYNKRFKVKVKVDFLDESARNMKKVNFSLYANYMNKTESLSHNVDGYENNGYAEADMTLYYPPSYDEDKDTNVKYFFKATHERGDKILDSEKLSMPQETHFVELKKDDYDENGAQKYNKPQSGETYKIKGVVKTLQDNLITMGFLEKNTDDGYFGDSTDKAVREFQDYAIKSDRMKRKVGKIEKAEKVLDQQASDGIVGKKTADEIDLWLRKDWVKPIPVYRKGEYDDKGVSNGKGKKGTDDHHAGTPIVAAQEDLQKVGLYQEFLIDGWFHDHLYEAVKQFQEAAQDGKFLINDVLTDIGKKLTNYREGIFCPQTQDFLKTVVEKKGKVAKEDQPEWIKIAKKEIGEKEVKGDKANPRILEYHSATNLDKTFASSDEVAWCSSFVNWVMQQVGYDGTKNAAARSWEHWGKKINKPVYGCITIIDYSYKGEKFKKSGHVGFAIGKDEKHISLLGGNQSDRVKISNFRLAEIENYLTYVIPTDYEGKGQELKPFKGTADETNFSQTR